MGRYVPAAAAGGGAVYNPTITITEALTCTNSVLTGLITAVGSSPIINVIEHLPSSAANDYAAYTLPDATTLTEGDAIYLQGSTAIQGLRVRDNSARLLGTIKGSFACYALLVDNSTAAGKWELYGPGWFLGPVPLNNATHDTPTYPAATLITGPYYAWQSGMSCYSWLSSTLIAEVRVNAAATKTAFARVLPVANGQVGTGGAWATIADSSGGADGDLAHDDVMDPSSIRVVGLSATQFVVMVRTTTATAELVFIACSVAATTVTAGDPKNLDSGDTTAPPTTTLLTNIGRLSATQFYFTWQLTSVQRVIEATIASNVITWGTSAIIGGANTYTAQPSMSKATTAAAGTFVLNGPIATGATGYATYEHVHTLTWNDPGWTVVAINTPGNTLTVAGALITVHGGAHPDAFVFSAGPYLNVLHLDETGFLSAGPSFREFSYDSNDLSLANVNTASLVKSAYAYGDVFMGFGNGTGRYMALSISDLAAGATDYGNKDGAIRSNLVQVLPVGPDISYNSIIIAFVPDDEDLAGSGGALTMSVTANNLVSEASYQIYEWPLAKFGRIA